MTFAVRAWTRPKAGHTPAENEDAWAASDPAGPLVVAVADGATEGAFSGGWARALVAAFVAAGGAARAGEAVARSRARWAAETEPLRAGLPWYAEAKLDEGAFATLAVVEATPGGYRAWCVGDAEVFEVRGVALVRVGEGTFTNRPALVGSRPGPPPEAVVVERPWPPGTALLVATDALAAWLVAAGTAHAARAFRDDFDGALAHARAHGLKSDDVTLVWIEAAP